MKNIVLLSLVLLPLGVKSQELKNRILTVHQHGELTIQDYISFEAQKGDHVITYNDFLQSVQPHSFFVFVDGKPVQTRYLKDANTDDFQKQFVGKQLVIYTETQPFSGILKDFAKGGYWLEQADRTIVFIANQSIKVIQYPAFSADFTNKAQLEIAFSSKKKEKETAIVLYDAFGVNWNPSYKLILDKDMKTATFQSLAGITNETNTDLSDIQLRLAFGNMRQDNSPVSPRKYAMAKMSTEADFMVGSVPELASVGDAYELVYPEKISLKKFENRKLVLDDVQKLPVKKWYEFQSYGSNREKENPSIKLKFYLSEKNGFKYPLAGGEMDVYQQANDELKSMSTTTILNKALNEDVELDLGKAMDVFVSETITENTQVNSKVFTASFKVEIKNSKKESVKVLVKRDFDSNTIVTESSQKYEQVNANQIQFWVEIGAGKSVSFSYKTRTEYR
jgi:hypothetical protein